MARPRSVSEKDTLEKALILFWERGYERTSIADLSNAIGVGPSSVYNTFGSKEEIFRRALSHYMETHAAFAAQRLADGQKLPADEAIGALLKALVVLYTTQGLPAGCAMLQSGGPGVADESVACAITWELKQDVEKSLAKLFEARKKRGDALAASPRTLAKFVIGTMRGLSQLACDGTSRAELQRIAKLAARSCVV